MLRPILNSRKYIGLVGGRDIQSVLKNSFNVQETDFFQVKSEASFPNSVSKPHYPDTFYEMKEQTMVKNRGDIFLVGAGVLGKFYCHQIKEQGGIAIDLGAMFDAWTGIKSRLTHPMHSIDIYSKHPKITRSQAIERYNFLIEDRGLDTPKAGVNDLKTLLEW